MVRLRLLALLAALAAAGGAAAEAGPPPVPLAVVAHRAVPPARMGVAETRRVFLLRRRFWSDGTPVRPVNLPAASPLRDAFSRAVLGRPARALADYWRDQYFHGTQPPPVLQSEGAVLLFVARTPGAAGYVSLAALRASPMADSVRVLLTVP